MMSRMIKSGRSRRHNSTAPLPVCEPAMVKPSFSRLYWISEYRSESSSISTIFFIALYSQSNGPDVTTILQSGEQRLNRRGDLLTPSIFLLSSKYECGHQSQEERRACRAVCRHVFGHGNRTPATHYAASSLRASRRSDRGGDPKRAWHSWVHSFASSGKAQERGAGTGAA